MAKWRAWVVFCRTEYVSGAKRTVPARISESFKEGLVWSDDVRECLITEIKTKKKK